MRFLSIVLTFIVTSVLFLAGCAGSGTFALPLTISSTSPLGGETSVSTTTRITATFSEPIVASSINSTTFTARAAGVLLPGTLSTVGNTATLQLSSPLPTSTVITATITRGAVAISSSRLSTNYVWSFTTGTTGDTTAPTVSSTDPADTQTGVSITKKVVAIFSEPMTASTVNTGTFSISGPSGNITGSVTLLNNVATFSPTLNLATNSVYTATITTGVRDLSNNAMAVNKVWSFTTGTNSDTTPPTVVSTNPATSATGVPINQTVTAAFSRVC